MASMKTMMMMLLDVSPSMREPVSDSISASKLELGKAFIGHFILQRMMASKTAEFGVATYGDNFTRNYLNATQGGYDLVNEVVSMERPTTDTLSAIHRIRGGNQTGDLIDGIVVAQDVLVRVNAKNKFNRIMLVITDGETRVEGVEDLEVVVQQMKSMNNFGLYIAMLGKVNATSSVEKQENAKLLHSLATLTGGRFLEVENFTESIVLLSGGLGLGTRPTLSKTVFELTPSLQLPCVYWSRVSKLTPPSLKKQISGAQAEEADVLRRDISYRHPDDEEVEIPVEEKVKGFKYGPQYIPVSPAEEELFKLPPSNLTAGPKLTLLGLVTRASLPRELFLDTPSYLLPQVNHSAAEILLATLHRQMLQEEAGEDGKKVMLCRFVKRDQSDPVLIAMIPVYTPNTNTNADENSPQERGFVFYRVPCVEDVRDYQFPSLVTFASSKKTAQNATLTAQQTAMRSFLATHTLSMGQQATKAILKPHLAIHTVYHTLHSRLLYASETNLVPLGDPLATLLPTTACATAATASSTVVKPNQSIPNHANPALLQAMTLQQLQEIFPVKAPEKTSRRKKKSFWSDITTTNTDEEQSSGVQSSSLSQGLAEVWLTDSATAVTGAEEEEVQPAAMAQDKEEQHKRRKVEVIVPTDMVIDNTTGTNGNRYGVNLQSAALRREPNPAMVYEPMDNYLDDLPEFLVGSITPFDDFMTYVTHIRALPIHPDEQLDLLTDGMKTLIKVIERAIHIGSALMHYERGITLLQGLHQVSYEEYDSTVVNQYLIKVVKPQYGVVGNKHHLFWELVKQQDLRPIGSSEISSSNVSDEEAMNYF